MAVAAGTGHFVHNFAQEYSQYDPGQERDRFDGAPLLTTLTDEAEEAIRGIEAFRTLPESNQELVLGMSERIISSANAMSGSVDAWKQNYWGLYMVGSRATGKAFDDSDLDLLSVGTFYRQQGFDASFAWGSDGGNDLFVQFDLEVPEELPGKYNVGDIDRKYLVRATPKKLRRSRRTTVPVDLNVVDLTFMKGGLEQFKAKADVDDDGAELPRLPLVEVTVEANYSHFKTK